MKVITCRSGLQLGEEQEGRKSEEVFPHPSFFIDQLLILCLSI